MGLRATVNLSLADLARITVESVRESFPNHTVGTVDFKFDEDTEEHVLIGAEVNITPAPSYPAITPVGPLKR